MTMNQNINEEEWHLLLVVLPEAAGLLAIPRTNHRELRVEALQIAGETLMAHPVVLLPLFLARLSRLRKYLIWSRRMQ